MPSMSFATFLIICPTSFFLGILFSLFPYDYPLLWAPQPPPTPHLDLLEQHLKLLYHSPPLITQLFHLILGVGLLGLVIKLYKPSESNMLFDGGSLVLYMVAVIVYIANTVKGLRIVDVGVYGIGLPKVAPDEADGVDASGYDVDTSDSVLGREDNLKVLSASNTILALVLLGVLVLQVGQWYAEKADEKVKKDYAEQERKEKKDERKESAAGSGGAEVKRQPSSAKGDKKKQ